MRPDITAGSRFPDYPPVATHGSELPYVLDLPDAPLQEPLDPDQEALAASMRAAWGELRGERRPVAGSSALAVVRRQCAHDVARAAAATGRHGLRVQAPLLVLGRQVATRRSPHALPTQSGGRVAGRSAAVAALVSPPRRATWVPCTDRAWATRPGVPCAR